MPKTHTDDVGPVLPSAIEGPFEVVDPTDRGSYFKIDPELAKITAVGGARPLRRRYLGYARNTGVSGAALLGEGMACRQVNVDFDAGFYTNAIGIPHEMDVAEPSSVLVLIAAAASSMLSQLAVRIEVTATYAKDGQSSPHTTTVTCDYEVPDLWQADAVEVVRVPSSSTLLPNPSSEPSRNITQGTRQHGTPRWRYCMLRYSSSGYETAGSFPLSKSSDSYRMSSR